MLQLASIAPGCIKENLREESDSFFSRHSPLLNICAHFGIHTLFVLYLSRHLSVG